VPQVPGLKYTRRVEFAETDAAGIVHFSMFFRYMEEAEHAVWRNSGLDILNVAPNLSWPRISAHCDFKAPLKFQDEFEVRTTIGAVTRSTIQWSHTLMRGETRIASGTVTVVCVSKADDGSMKSSDLPEAVISRLRAALAS
jgi:acyl-CoA thioester hydrolase